jgi:hypothetical protein
VQTGIFEYACFHTFLPNVNVLENDFRSFGILHSVKTKKNADVIHTAAEA